MQIKRGLHSSLPSTALTGEPVWTTDTHQLYVGTGSSLIEFSSTSAVAAAISAAISGLVFPSSAGPTTHEWIASYNATTGAFTLTRPDYSDLTGTPQLAQTIANATHKWLNSYNATTGLFTQTQPDYSDLTGTPIQPSSAGPTTHQFVTAYNASTGVFTLAQPAYTDISGTPTLPSSAGPTTHQFFTSYNSSTGVFTLAQPAATDITGLATIATTGKWSDLQNPTASLTLSMGGNNSTFTDTTAFTTAYKNTTSATGSSAPTLVASQFISAAGTGGQTNGSSITTTGATLLVAVMSIFNPGAGGLPTIADGLGNTWNYTPTIYSLGSQIMGVRTAYAFSHAGGALSTGSDSFTVTINGAGSWTAAIYAFSGTLTTSSVYNSTAGVGHNGGVIVPSPFQVGEFTPGPGDIVVTNITNGSNVYTSSSINEGFGNVLNGARNGATAAVLIGATGETLNPTWTFSGGGSSFGQIVSFRAATTTVANSPISSQVGTWWNGSASAADTWSLQNTPGAGINGVSILSLTHSGSSLGQLQVPGLSVFDTTPSVMHLSNTTAATATVVQNSVALSLDGTFFYNGGSNPDSWILQNQPTTPQSVSITNISESAGSVVTLTLGAATPFTALTTGSSVTLSGLTVGTWLNGLTVTLVSTAGTSLSFNDPTGHGTQASTGETGTATQANPTSILAFKHSGSAATQIQVPSPNLKTNPVTPMIVAEGVTTAGISLNNNIGNPLQVFASGSSSPIVFFNGATQHGHIANQVTAADFLFIGDGNTTGIGTNAPTAANTFPICSIGFGGNTTSWASTSSAATLMGVNIGTKINQVGDNSLWINWQPPYGSSNFHTVDISPTITQTAVTGTVAGVQVVGNVAVINFQANTGTTITVGSTTDTAAVTTNTSVNGSGNITTTAVTNRTTQTITNVVESRVALTLSSVANASGGTTVYTGTITNGGAALGGNYVGAQFVVAGFTTGANNGTFICTASTTTTLTLNNASGVSETHAATATFSNVVMTTGAGSAYAAGDYLYFTGLTTATWLNGQVAKALSAVAGTSVTFADPTGHAANSASDTGSCVASWVTYAKTTSNITLVADTGTFTQQSTGTYTMLFVNPTESAVNSNAHKLMDLQVGGVSKFYVDRAGNVVGTGSLSIPGVAASVGTGMPVPTGTKHEVVFNNSTTLSSSSGNNWPGGGWGTLGGTFTVNTNSSSGGNPAFYNLTSPASAGGAQLAENNVNNWFCMNLFSAYRFAGGNADNTAGSIRWLGLTAGVGAGALNVTNPNTTIWGFRYVQGTDTHWQAYVGTATGTFTATDTGITPDTNFHEFCITKNASGNLDFYIDGTKVATILSSATGFPSANTPVAPQLFIGVPSTSTSALDLYALQAWTKF